MEATWICGSRVIRYDPDIKSLSGDPELVAGVIEMIQVKAPVPLYLPNFWVDASIDDLLLADATITALCWANYHLKPAYSGPVRPVPPGYHNDPKLIY